MATIQLERRAAELVTAENNVLFDQIISSEGDISYDNTTGVITINQVGQFIINWWVATQSSTSVVGTVFSIHTSQGDPVIGASPVKTGTVFGSCTINVTNIPVEVSLVNETAQTVFYSPIVPVKAALVVTTGPQGETGSTGATGSTGPQGAIFPFAVSEGTSGIQIYTDDEGNPSAVSLLGFGSSSYNSINLQPGEWATGSITLGDSSAPYGTAFVMPTNGILRKIYVTFGNKGGFSVDEGVTLYPFVCLAASDGSAPVFTILQDTITDTAPYVGSTEPIPLVSLRSGSSTGLNVALAEGSLLIIIAGLRGEGVTSEQYGGFSIGGGMFIE